MKDLHGNEVAIGDIVRVLEIDQGLLDLLPDDELPHIVGMLHHEYPIDDIPEDGKASVSIWWEDAPGYIGYSGLYMLSHEFELVKKAGSTG